MHITPLEQQIASIITPSLEAKGYVPILVRMKEGTKSKMLEVIVERSDGQGMTVDDCTEVSHTVSALLDVEDPITGAYQLEVSSPGIERPLVSVRDFERYIDYTAKIETMFPLDGRKRYRGVIKAVKGEDIVILMDGQEVTLSYGQLRQARLVMTDELMQKYLREGKRRAEAE